MQIKKLDLRLLFLLSIFMLVDPVVMNWLFRIHFFSPIVKATNYLIQPTLLAGLIGIFLVSTIAFWLGNLDLVSIRLARRELKSAVLPLIGIWILSNIILAGLALATTGRVGIIQNFNIALGSFLGQTLGNAPFEEIVFRGIFFLQLSLIFKDHFSAKKAIILAILPSQLFFAVIHIPNRIWINQVDNLFFETAGLLGAGIGLTLIFIHTRNLFFSIGIHALANMPFIIVEGSPSLKYYLTYFLIVMTAVLWKRITPPSDSPGFWNIDNSPG